VVFWFAHSRVRSPLHCLFVVYNRVGYLLLAGMKKFENCYWLILFLVSGIWWSGMSCPPLTRPLFYILHVVLAWWLYCSVVYWSSLLLVVVVLFIKVVFFLLAYQLCLALVIMFLLFISHMFLFLLTIYLNGWSLKWGLKVKISFSSFGDLLLRASYLIYYWLYGLLVLYLVIYLVVVDNFCVLVPLFFAYVAGFFNWIGSLLKLITSGSFTCDFVL